MAERRRICFILGTRPEVIKCWPVIRVLDADERFDVTTILTGQHTDLAEQAVRLFGLRVDVDLKLMTPGQTLEGLTASLCQSLAAPIREAAPSVVAVQGDTTTAFVGALTAFYAGIPVAHIEAGLRSGDVSHPFPEEMNRRLIGGLASVHFAPTEGARQALLREGAPDGRIHVTGNSGIDALRLMSARLDREALTAFSPATPVEGSGEDSGTAGRSSPGHGGDPYGQARERITSVPATAERPSATPDTVLGSVPTQRIPPPPPELEAVLSHPGARIIAVTIHRRENRDFMAGIANAIRTILETHEDVRVVFPVHPGPAVRQAFIPVLRDFPRCHLIEPLNYADFVRLLKQCYFVLTDSGGIQEEAPYLGKPVLVTRRTTERPEAVAAGVVRIIGETGEAIIREVTELLADRDRYRTMSRLITPYGDGHAAERMAEILGVI